MLPSNSVTDRYVKAAIRRMAKKLENVYEDNFPHLPAGDEFWDRLSDIDTKLTDKLAKRPLARTQIDDLNNRAFKVLQKLLVAHAATIEQPQFRECVHIETGTTRLIPKHD